MEKSLDPNVWGSFMWDLLFYIAFRIDLKKNMAALQRLFNLLETVLPCSHCRRHYAIHKKRVSPLKTIQKSDSESAAKWLWIIHDMVNQELGKICISYETLVKRHTIK